MGHSLSDLLPTYLPTPHKQVFMYHRRHLVLLLLLLALVAGGSAVLTTARRQQQGRGADEDEGSSGGQAAALAAEGLGLGGSMKNGQGQGQGQGGERSVVEAALAAKRPKGGRAEEARRWRKEELLEELKELEGLLEGEEDLAELEEAFLEAGEAEEEQEADDDDDEARAAQAREEAWSARLGGAMEKMRQVRPCLVGGWYDGHSVSWPILYTYIKHIIHQHPNHSASRPSRSTRPRRSARRTTCGGRRDSPRTTAPRARARTGP